MNDESPLSNELSRRTALKRAGIITGGAAAVWVAPTVISLDRAFAASGSPAPGGSGSRYDLTDSFIGSGVAGAFSLYEPTDVLLSKPASLSNGSQTITGVEGTNNANSDASFPLVLKNNSGSTFVYTNGTLTVPAGALMVHPGDGVDLTIRFAAPSAGTYGVVVSLSDGDKGGDQGGVSYALSSSGTGAGATGVVDPTADANLSTSFVLGANGTIDLVIGSNGTYSNDTTIVSFTVTG